MGGAGALRDRHPHAGKPEVCEEEVLIRAKLHRIRVWPVSPTGEAEAGEWSARIVVAVRYTHLVAASRQMVEQVKSATRGDLGCDDVATRIEQFHEHAVDARLAYIIDSVQVKIAPDQVANGRCGRDRFVVGIIGVFHHRVVMNAAHRGSIQMLACLRRDWSDGAGIALAKSQWVCDGAAARERIEAVAQGHVVQRHIANVHHDEPVVNLAADQGLRPWRRIGVMPCGLAVHRHQFLDINGRPHRHIVVGVVCVTDGNVAVLAGASRGVGVDTIRRFRHDRTDDARETGANRQGVGNGAAAAQWKHAVVERHVAQGHIAHIGHHEAEEYRVADAALRPW